MLARLPAILKTIVAIVASMIVWPSALAVIFLIWGHDYGDAAKVFGVVVLSTIVLREWRRFLPRPKGPSSGTSTSFQTIMMWIVAGFFALSGVVSLTLHDSRNALVELGVATVIFLIIWLRRRLSLASQA